MINTSKSIGSVLGRVVPLVVLLATANVYAEMPVSINLTGASEVPPVTTSATGKGDITVLPDHTVRGSVTTSGMVPTMAHIHEAAVGKNGPPIITLEKSANGNFAVPPAAKLSDTEYKSFKDGNLYINVHSDQFPNGEIRGQFPRMK
jgi:hypothetical protein